ncbi:MAG: polysaccharide biosynthesis tyrosine autokinase [Symploca sp. SIO1B1]|nr:polysaccharide biosynthesis tyrosine autokinase [Symploca sp. SIO1C2]NER94918.1 polysaccharide biosynthesis tyrosine autokinase [Symploca sp. SIO1B1]
MESQQHIQDIDFQSYWLILRRRWLPGTLVLLLTVILATTAALLKQPTYAAQGKLLLKKRILSSLGTEAGEQIGELEALNNFINTPLDTEAQVITSRPLIEKTIEQLDLKNKAGESVKPSYVLGGLTVEGIKGTDVLKVSFNGPNPEDAAEVVNQLMQVYLQNNVLTNREEAVAAREFIAKQLPATEKTLRKAESDLRSFKEQNNIVSLKEEATYAVANIAELDKKISQTRSDLEDVAARSAALQGKLGLNSQQALALSSLSQSRGVQQALLEVEQIEDQLNVQRTRYEEKHPVIVNLKDRKAAREILLAERVEQVLGFEQLIPGESLQMGELEQSMTENLINAEVERLGLTNRVAALDRAKLTKQQRANILPRLQEGLRDRERKLAAAQSTYEILLKNYQEVQIAENQNVGNARIIAYAQQPELAVGPNKKLIIGAGVVAGSLLYIITAFVLDLMDPSIKTAKEVRRLFNYTWLGMIPDYGKKGFFGRKKLGDLVPQLPVRDAPHAVISEAYRMLEANLKFLSPDKELKVIVVTSSVSKEGKSTVSANLAIAMAQLGRRVLLIDADLRHPLQHHIWGLVNTQGLSEIIVNRAEFENAVKGVMDNLDVLPSGVIPPNSLALLNSKRMASLIKEFSRNYDFVIFDTPPLVLTADAITLGKMTDGMLLLARPGVIDRVSATASKEFLVRSGQKVLGLVVNGVSIAAEPDSYFHHAKSYYNVSHWNEVKSSQVLEVGERE